MKTYKTGQPAPVSGIYKYKKSINDKIACMPTQGETYIPLSRGEKFPPVKSCGSAARWKLIMEA